MRRRFFVRAALPILGAFAVADVARAQLPAPVDVRAPLRGGDSLRASRLAAVGRAWTAARFFHPSLVSDPRVDWDSALVRALPAIRNATTRAEYAAAVAGLFASLGDPATRVQSRARLAAPPGRAAEPPAAHDMDGALVVSLRDPDAIDDASTAPAIDRMGPQIDAARALVFDLRTREGARDPDLTRIAFQFLGLERGLAPRTLPLPAVRTWQWAGWPADDPSKSSASFHGAWRLAARRAFPANAPVSRRVAFLVNPRTVLPDIALALRAAGLALFVAEQGITDGGREGMTTRVALDDSTEVQLRTGELVWPDGGVGLAADTIVAPGTGGADPALAVALRWVRDTLAPRPLPLPRARLVVAPTLNPAYAAMRSPSAEWRILAAFRLWGTMEYFHAYRSLYEDDWYGVLQHMLPRLEAAADSTAYRATVRDMVHHVHDSHAYTSGASLAALIGRSPAPVRTMFLGDTLVVTHVVDDSVARATGLRRGDVIESIDGRTPRALAGRLAHLVAASNPWTLDRDIVYSLLVGNEGSEAAIRVQRADGSRRTMRVPRRAAYGPRLGPTVLDAGRLWRLDAGVGYVDLRRLGSGAQVDSAMRALATARALVLDVRGYPSTAAFQLAERLTDRPAVPIALSIEPRPYAPHALPSDGTGIADQEQRATYLQTIAGTATAGGWHGPVVVLVNETTQSRAEHLVLTIVAAAPYARIVGSPSAGANGDATNLVLPGGITVNFSGDEIRWPDGRQLQRVGIRPHVLARPTLRGMRAGRDEVLEQGMTEARRQLAGPHRKARAGGAAVGGASRSASQGPAGESRR